MGVFVISQNLVIELVRNNGSYSFMLTVCFFLCSFRRAYIDKRFILKFIFRCLRKDEDEKTCWCNTNNVEIWLLSLSELGPRQGFRFRLRFDRRRGGLDKQAGVESGVRETMLKNSPINSGLGSNLLRARIFGENLRKSEIKIDTF